MEFLTLFISLRCTNACSHCLYGYDPDHGENMSLEVFKRSLAIAKAGNIKMINFFGGEPLVNPDFFSMLQIALENRFDLILATNCRPLTSKVVLDKFLDVTGQYKECIEIVTAKDRFHLRYFDPEDIVTLLQKSGYKIIVNEYSNYSILISEHNVNVRELRELDTRFSCCGDRWSDALGILPNGKWTICPTSLEPFGGIYSITMSEIVEFKKKLPLRYKDGCTICLKDFKEFRKKFEKERIQPNK
jgi:organic radical activating enzyme